MNNRTFAALLAATLLTLTACTSHAEPRPNVVLVIADDLNVGDIERAMPRTAALAEQAVVFDAAFTPLALCSPARISLLTGTLPRTHGFRSNDVAGFDASDTIATRLQDGGYSTTVVGKLLNDHWRATNVTAGWDDFRPFRDHRDHGREQSDVLAAQTLECMSGPAPVFCYVGAVAPHGPNFGPPRCDSRDQPPRISTSSENRWAQRMSALCGLDDMVASIVEARSANTYVILSSDNGWMYGEAGRVGKSELVLDAAQIPLIVWGPGLRGHHRRELVSLVDVSATVLRLANVGRAGLDGQSLLPLLRESSDRWTGRLEIEGQ